MESRLRLIRKELKLTQEALASRLGVGKSALSMIETGKAALSERNKNILVQEFGVNAEWIDTGMGNMFSVRPEYINSARAACKDILHRQNVPLYNVDKEGLVTLLSDDPACKPVDYIHIPNLPKCDGAIYLVGDSMYPLLKSGDIVIYKKLHGIEDIFWGDMYLLSIDIGGEEYVTVRYVQRSEKRDSVKLVSYNPRHADKEIEISRILALAFVKASICINSLL